MKNRTIFSVFFLLSLLPLDSYGQINRSQQNIIPFENLEEGKRYLHNQTINGLFSGAVLVRDNSTIHLVDAYGYANVEEKIKNQPDTKINIGSINKIFTSVCIMQLIEQNKLSMDDLVTSFIPELTMEMAHEITIGHLLEMKSGLGTYHGTSYFQNHHLNLKNMEDYIPAINALKLNFKPGSNRRYSNAGYELLGIVIQRITKRNYYDYVKENVYEKAGMINTDAFARDSHTPNLAHGYSQYAQGEPLGSRTNEDMLFGSFNKNVNNWHAVKGTAAGGGYSTLNDLYAFLIALNGNRLISKPSTELVMNKFRSTEKRRTTFRMGGGSYGINAAIYFNTINEKAVIVLANYDPPIASNMATRLYKTFNK